MNNLRIAKILSWIVMAAGALVMIGWIADIEFLKIPIVGNIDIKFMTAATFLLSGVLFYFIIKFAEGDEDGAQVVLPIVTLLILLIMATLFVSVLVGVDTGIARLFVVEAPGAIKTQFPGTPSVDTMVEFILIAAAGLAVMFKCIKLKSILKWLGAAVVFGGAIALVGYIFNIPFFYFSWQDISNPIAPAAAMLFVACGTILILTSREISKTGLA